MGPASARAEHVGNARSRRAGRARRPRHGDAAGVRTAHRATMRRSSSLRDHHSREQVVAEVGGWRFWLVGALLTLCGIALLSRAVYLQVVDQKFLKREG